MKSIVRETLSDEAMTYLEKQTTAVTKKRSPTKRKEFARQRWESAKKTKAFKEIRQKLEKMTSGLLRCMYCEDSRADAIDHFWPLALYPDKSFEWDNYFLACAHCNSNCKQSQFPTDATGQPLLIDPTREDPLAHLVLTPLTGRFGARSGSAKATKTIDSFHLNLRPELITGRRDAFIALQMFIVEYANMRRAGKRKAASEIKQLIMNHPFGGIFIHLLRIAESPRATTLRREFLDALEDYPEIKTWR